MHLDDFKAAALRVFYDIVNADGIIDIEEIKKLDKLKKEYGIISHDGQENPVLINKAYSMTLGEALTTLAQWKNPEINKEQHADKYSSDMILQEAKCLADCDGGCSTNEAAILLAMDYVLVKKCVEPAKVISCKARDLKFSKNEIIYIADDDGTADEEQLQDEETLDSITSKLKLYGFDFVYIPQVIKFLTQTNANDSTLSKIMMFTHPLLLSNVADIKRFLDSLRTVTTSEFTEYYFGKQGNACADIWGASWLMMKIATSRKISSEEKGYVKFESYNDFLLIPFGEDVKGIVNEFLKKYIDLVKCVSQPVVMYSQERVHSKRFHKTILDYVMYKSRTLNKIVLDLSGQKIIFEGLGEFFQLPLAQFALYLFIIARKEGVTSSSDDMQQYLEYSNLYEALTNEKKELCPKTIGSKISKIKGCIEDSLHIDNKDFYIPHNDKSGRFIVDAPKNLFYIRDASDSVGEHLLKDWYKRNVLNK